MRDLLTWNVSLGRWAGVEVRLHVFFILFAVVAIHFGMQHGLVVYMLTMVGLLLASVAAHEFGHCVAAWRVGRQVDQLFLWPLGGLTHVGASQNPYHELMIALAGSMVNLAVCLMLFPLLFAMEHESLALLNPLNPPVPALDASISLISVLNATFWINWVLVLVNLLPAIPLDGSRAARALVWPRLGYRSAVLVVAAIAQGTAVAMWMAAWLVHSYYPFATLPLALLGVLVFFAARQEADRVVESESGAETASDEDPSGYASLQTTTSTVAPRQAGLLRRWLETRRADRERRRRQREQEEEHRVDEVLARLHAVGREGLSVEDRALLDRVSERYRNRQRD